MNEVPIQVSAPLTRQMRTALEVLERERAREDMRTHIGAVPKDYKSFRARGALEGVRSEGEFWSQFPGAGSVMPEVRAAAASSKADLLPEELEKLRGVRALDRAREMAVNMAATTPGPGGHRYVYHYDPEVVLAKGRSVLARYREPGTFRQAAPVAPNPAWDIANNGLVNVRSMSVENLVRAGDMGVLPAPSSALIPSTRLPDIGTGYQGSSGSVRVYLGPEWTIPNPELGIVTYRGDAWTPRTNKFIYPGPPSVPKRPHSFLKRLLRDLDVRNNRPRNMPYVLSLDPSVQSLPESFYGHLTKHRILENKAFNNIPLSDVRGIGIDADVTTQFDIDRARRVGDQYGIPYQVFSGADAGPFDSDLGELDVQKALAPVIHMDAKGGNAGTRADEEGGDGGSEPASSETAVPEQPAPQQSGPRIVVNPTVFEDDKDALCVAFNEAFRIVMEDMAFDPVSEPTEKQRKFFSDTDYKDNETQLRRTILARICTFDTSVKDPTDEQLQEAVEFLENVMEAGYPQDESEQAMVQRIHDVVTQSIGRPQATETGETSEPPTNESVPTEEPEAVQGDIGGGESRYAYTKNGIDYDINDNPLTKAESNPDYAYTKDGINYDINDNPLNVAQAPGPTTPQNQAEAATPKESDEPKEESTLDQMLEQAQTGELFGENPMSSVDNAPDRVWNELADVQSVEMEEGPTVTLTASGAQTSGGFGGPLTLSARPRGRGFADVGGPLTTNVSYDGRIENGGTERSKRAALRGFI